MIDLTEQITREYKIEQDNKSLAINPDDIPISYEAITSQWLTHILCKDYPGAEVIQHQLDTADDGNTNRMRIFLTYNAAGNDAALPTSVFCKSSHKLANRLALANVGSIKGEMAFYNDYRALLDIEAPNCLFATCNFKSYNSIIMLDDLSRDGAEFCDYDTEMTRQRAESQLALLASLHGKFYDSPEVKGSDLHTFEQFFNIVDTWFGITECCYNGFLMAESVIPSRLFRRHEEIWPATLKSVALHGAEPRTFTHIDSHFRNWYIAANGQMGLCDWQTFGLGHWARDVAYTLSTSLTIENRRAWERELLAFYLEKFHQAGGPLVPFDQGWQYYRQHLFTSLAWWTLTIAPSGGSSGEAPPDFQPEQACLTFIERMATAIDDLDALDSFN